MWHASLCYLNVASNKLLVRHELADGNELLHDDTADNLCKGCCYEKQQHTPFPVNLVRKFADHPRDLVHVDIMGPMDTGSIGGAFYYLIVKDDAIAYQIAFCLKHKSNALSAL